MMETVILLKPESEWPKAARWYSSWAPNWLRKMLRRVWPDHKSPDELKYGPGGLDETMKLPGVTNDWTMPIKARIDMLSTGIKSDVGIKIMGADLQKIQEIGEHIEMVLKDVPGTKNAFAERTAGGYFIDFTLRREQLARYGLTIDQANSIVMSAIGGENVTTTIEGRERYPVNVRYFRELRDDIEKLRRVFVPVQAGTSGAAASGGMAGMGGSAAAGSGGVLHIPITELAEISLKSGPSMIRDENGRLTGFVTVNFDTSKRDIGGYVADAKKAVLENVKMPPGYQLIWSGQFEFMESVNKRLIIVVPITIFLVFLLLFFNTRSFTKTMIILLALPFSAVGAIWFLLVLQYHVSAAVWVGLIALMGVDAETGMFMLLYLDLAHKDAEQKGKMRNWDDLREAIVEGAVKRLRPKVMTVGVMFMGLVPIMWSAGAGADTMKRIAAPMIGGIFTSFIMELCVYPAIYAIWKWNFGLKKQLAQSGASPT
jgi:Cu(I)/Ag(I) efflux system membrane protein CusA/SilA